VIRAYLGSGNVDELRRRLHDERMAAQ